MEFDAGTWWLVGLATTAAIGAITYFLRRTISQVDSHDKAINLIQRTYVTQDDFKAYKSQSREDIKQLTEDVSELKDRCLTKEDFYRAQSYTNERLEQIYKLLQDQRGGQ